MLPILGQTGEPGFNCILQQVTIPDPIISFLEESVMSLHRMQLVSVGKDSTFAILSPKSTELHQKEQFVVIDVE